MVVGKYVNTFAEASHALPVGMHMGADYPFMLPLIAEQDQKSVTIQSSRGLTPQTLTFKIIRQNGREYGYITQSSAFELIFKRPPTRFKVLPFKDERTDVKPLNKSTTT
jgi:hypothetical protein